MGDYLLLKYKNIPIAILNIIINSTDDSIFIPKLPKRKFAKADNMAVDNNVYIKIFILYKIYNDIHNFIYKKTDTHSNIIL